MSWYRSFIVIVILLQLPSLVLAQMPQPGPGEIPSQPNIRMGNITFSDPEPLEGDLVEIIAPVSSMEPTTIENITVHFLVDQTEIGNVTLDLEAMSEANVTMEWVAEKWTHIIAVTLDVAGRPVPTAISTRSIEVEAEPIGDVPTLLSMLGAILLAILVLTVAPSILALARR
jgi:hypothetical protein